MIKELDPVVLTQSLPEQGLLAGDVGRRRLRDRICDLGGRNSLGRDRAGWGGASRTSEGNRARTDSGV